MPASQRSTYVLYPAIAPRASGMLAVGESHRIYWEESGNPAGVPVVFLHGGPGAGSTPDHRRFFDPDFYRIIVFDQRGAGRSEPHAAIADNTTAHLIADLERLRETLDVDRWLIFGGSWGSTLALAYGETHPARCLGFILRGVFLGRPHEIDWFLYGLKRFFPEAWRTFREHIPKPEQDDLLRAYHRRLIDPQPRVHMPAAHSWAGYESACSTLRPNHDTVRHFGADRHCLSLARIEAHYFVNDCFLATNALLDNLKSIRHLPCHIVQGRYDAVCPIATADELAASWPQSRYVIVPDAGHSAWEPGILAALVTAAEQLKGDISSATSQSVTTEEEKTP
jgi:proline iminopeptidase